MKKKIICFNMETCRFTYEELYAHSPNVYGCDDETFIEIINEKYKNKIRLKKIEEIFEKNE